MRQGRNDYVYRHSIVPYRTEWPKLYAAEAETIKGVLRGDLLYLEHVGSTAIVGASGNPVIDIVAIVRDLKRLDIYKSALRTAGYDEIAPAVVDSRLFKKDLLNEENTEQHRFANLYCFPDEHPRMAAMIDNRDYLLAHPDETRKFEEINKKLTSKYSKNPEKYDEKKGEYLKQLQRHSAKWRGRNVDEEWGRV